MCETKKDATRFRHHFLNNGGVLTVATCLEYETRTVRVGWAIFNPSDDRWVRKMGTYLARTRMNDNPLRFQLTEDEPIVCDYISLRALTLILAVSDGRNGIPKEVWSEHPSAIPKSTLVAIQYECYRIIDLLCQRVGVPVITTCRGQIND